MLTEPSRSLGSSLEGPREDNVSDHNLNQLWEEHCKHEFATRDVEATLDTMVDDAYVNHIPD